MQRTQIDTTVQPRLRIFSYVGILSCIRRQKIKEREGGMLTRQIRDAQDKAPVVGQRKA